uniref:NADH dehydrogenase subunit 3 n=1 Tax=Panagrolaimus sp. JU765 TaxID=591449 RepID=A0AC34RPZ0_9BILA
MDPSNYEMEMALVLLIAVGVTVASVIIISGVALIWSFYDEKAEKKLQEKMEEKQPSKIDKTKKVDAKPKTDAPIIAQK